MAGFRGRAAVLQTPLFDLRQQIVHGARRCWIMTQHLEEAFLDLVGCTRGERAGLTVLARPLLQDEILDALDAFP